MLKNGEAVILKTPNIRDYHLDMNYSRLESLFMVSLLDMELNPENYGFSAASYLDLILGTKMREEDNPVLSLLEKIADVKITKQSITCNGVPLREEDVLELRYAYLLSIGRVDINGNPIGGKTEEEEDERERKLRESEEKIRALRGNKHEEKKVSFKEILTLVMYELGKSPEELAKLNFYGVYELYALASAVVYDKITKIAAGNGLLPEDKAYKNILSD